MGRACGFVQSTPRTFAHPDDVFHQIEDSDIFTQSTYSCASATRAIIKTVTFTYNETLGLEGLRIENITDKVYDDERLPLWGFEKTNYTFGEIEPLFGLVADEYEHHPNMSTLRREHLWLAGYDDLRDVSSNRQYLPAASVPTRALAAMYAFSRANTLDYAPDYSGQTDFSMYRRWFELSKNASDAATILNLMWTDIACNAMLGTKGWASEGSTGRGNLQPVTIYQRHLRYKLVYAIPAFLLATVFVTLAAIVLLLLVLGKTSIGQMRYWLDQTSLGRNLTSLLYLETSSQQLSGKLWKQTDGMKSVTLTPSRPFGTLDSNSQDAETRPTNGGKETTSFLISVHGGTAQRS